MTTMTVDTSRGAADVTHKSREVEVEGVHFEDIPSGENGNQKEDQALAEEEVNPALERRVKLKCDLMILPLVAMIYFLAQLVSNHSFSPFLVSVKGLYN